MVLQAGNHRGAELRELRGGGSLMLHSHLDPQAPYPSIQDIISSEKLARLAPAQFVVSTRGVTEFRPPRPIDGRQVDPRDLVLHWLIARGMHVAREMGMAPITDLTKAEQNDLSRQFLIEHGMIVGDTPWDDVVGIEAIVGRINAATGAPEVTP